MGVQVLSLNDVKDQLEEHCVIVTVGRDKKDEIMGQLEQNNVKSIMYYEDVRRKITREKIESRVDL